MSKFDLSLVMAERREGLLVHFEYNTDLYDRSTIDRMVGHFETLLDAIVADQQQDQPQPATTLPILTPAELQQILYDWNATEKAFADSSCIHTLIEQRTADQPDATAIYFRDEVVSYRELNERANRIAHYLNEQGADTGDIVGVCLNRSVDLVATLLGIFKSGAAYVPLDP
ncbi:MAG: AMP-binding protein, partial [Fuerstiella sp.]|nr:AMP-binding protein [Fuerstiella sp.]